jgi:hypothetical protein
MFIYDLYKVIGLSGKKIFVLCQGLDNNKNNKNNKNGDFKRV